MEDPDQNIHLRNLSLQQSANEEEALNLLFLGDTNRMIAEVRKRGNACFHSDSLRTEMYDVTSTFEFIHHTCSVLRQACSQYAKIHWDHSQGKWHELYFLSTNALCTLKTLLKYYFGPLWPFFTMFLPSKTSILSVISVYVAVVLFYTQDTQTPHADETCGGSAFALQPEVWSKGLISPCLLLLLVCK